MTTTPAKRIYCLALIAALSGLVLTATPVLAQEDNDIAVIEKPQIDEKERDLGPELLEKSPPYIQRVTELRQTAFQLIAQKDPDLFVEYCRGIIVPDEDKQNNLSTYLERAKNDKNIVSYIEKIQRNEERRRREIWTELYTEMGYKRTQLGTFIAVMNESQEESREADMEQMRQTALQEGLWSQRECDDATNPQAATSFPLNFGGAFTRLGASTKTKTDPVYAANVKELLK